MKLYDYQKEISDKCMSMLNTYKGCGLFAQTRLGKTIITLDLIKRLGSRTAIIVAPLSVIDLCVWQDEAKLWAPEYRVIDLTRDKVDQETGQQTIYLLNYEQVKKHRNKWKDKEGLTIIFDEAHRLKNSKSQRTKTCTALADRCQYKILLTGTPRSNTDEDFYSLVRVIRGQEAWKGASFWKWQRELFHMTERYVRGAKSIWIADGLREDKCEAFYKYVEATCMFVDRKDVLDSLPKQTTYKSVYSWSAKTEKAYKDMWRNFVCELDNKEITAANAAVKLIRLQQILGLDTNRIANLVKLLEDVVLVESSQVIVWTTFREEQHAVYEELRKRYKIGVVNGSTKNEDRKRVFRAFQDGRLEVLLATTSTIGEGIPLDNADVTVYYTSDYSYIKKAQSSARTFKVGKKNDLKEYNILCENKLGKNDIPLADSLVYNSVSNKEKQSELTKKFIKELRKEV